MLLIANHAGNTFAWDGAMLSMAMFLEAEPPRIVRGMGEYFLTTLPFFNVMDAPRRAAWSGARRTARGCSQHGEAIMAFPEGERGFVKTYRQRYQLQRFGLGFMRLALETATPIVPIGIVGSEEQSPGLANLRWLGRLIGSPAFPITADVPVPRPRGLPAATGAVPHPLRQSDPVRGRSRTRRTPRSRSAWTVVKDEIRRLIADGLAARKSWFT